MGLVNFGAFEVPLFTRPFLLLHAYVGELQFYMEKFLNFVRLRENHNFSIGIILRTAGSIMSFVCFLVDTIVYFKV